MSNHLVVMCAILAVVVGCATPPPDTTAPTTESSELQIATTTVPALSGPPGTIIEQLVTHGFRQVGNKPAPGGNPAQQWVLGDVEVTVIDYDLNGEFSIGIISTSTPIRGWRGLSCSPVWPTEKFLELALADFTAERQAFEVGGQPVQLSGSNDAYTVEGDPAKSLVCTTLRAGK